MASITKCILRKTTDWADTAIKSFSNCSFIVAFYYNATRKQMAVDRFRSLQTDDVIRVKSN
jgi:hypothetical protein